MPIGSVLQVRFEVLFANPYFGLGSTFAGHMPNLGALKP